MPFPVRPVLVITALFYINFLSRNVIAPLLPVIVDDFGLGFGRAGTLFLFSATGMCTGLLTSGFVSSRLTHRYTVLLSAMGMGIVLLVMTRLPSVNGIYICLLFLGITGGFYMPSGMAILTEIASSDHWGKVMAIHEMGPTIGLVTAPLLVECFLNLASWQGIIGLLGISQFFISALFFKYGIGGRTKGKRLHLKTVGSILKTPSLPIITIVFILVVSAADGLYAMLPLYLVKQIGFERPTANTIVGFSNITGILIVFLSGLITDRMGARRAMTVFSAATGISTLMLALLHGPLITPMLVFFQATAKCCLFPPILVIAALIFPPYMRNLGLSVLFSITVLFGAGMIPLLIGYLAETFSFSFSIGCIGLLVLTIIPLMSSKKLEACAGDENQKLP